MAVTGWARGDNDGVEGDDDVVGEELSEGVDGWSRDDGVSGREKGDILGCLAPPIEVNYIAYNIKVVTVVKTHTYLTECC